MLQLRLVSSSFDRPPQAAAPPVDSARVRYGRNPRSRQPFVRQPYRRSRDIRPPATDPLLRAAATPGGRLCPRTAASREPDRSPRRVLHSLPARLLAAPDLYRDGVGRHATPYPSG